MGTVATARGSHKQLFVAFALTAWMLAHPGPARGDHLEPTEISPPGASASLPEIDSNRQRTAVAVWRETDGDTAAIRAAVRTPEEGWGPSVRISDLVAHAEAHAVSMDGTGNAVAVWQIWVGGTSMVQASVRAAGGSWSPPQSLELPDRASYTPSIAVEAGRAVAVWAAESAGSIVRASAYSFASPGWTTPATVSEPGLAWLPKVALADDGSAVAVWRRWRNGHFVIQAAALSATGVWAAPEDLSAPGADARPPQVAADAAGNAVAAWVRPSGGTAMAQVAHRPAGGSWGAARNLSHRGFPVRSVELDMNRAGDAIVAWRHIGTLWSSSRPRDASGWQARDQIEPYCARCDSSISLDEEGNATAAWSAIGSIEASFKPVGKDWQDRYLISEYEDLTYRPDVVVDGNGRAVAAWIRQGSNHDRIQAVAYTIETAAEEAALDAASAAVEAKIDKCYEEAETDTDFEKCEKLEDELLGIGDEDGGERVDGTPRRDILRGTRGNDVFFTYGGNDVIYGLGGRDVIYGGPGNDRLVGGKGSDLLIGGSGRDRLIGGRGADRMMGGSGRDRLSGARGSDLLFARDRQRDLVSGGPGLDRYRLDRVLDRRARGIERRYS
jgi:hypothetical protein